MLKNAYIWYLTLGCECSTTHNANSLRRDWSEGNKNGGIHFCPWPTKFFHSLYWWPNLKHHIKFNLTYSFQTPPLALILFLTIESLSCKANTNRFRDSLSRTYKANKPDFKRLDLGSPISWLALLSVAVNQDKAAPLGGEID